MSEAQVRALLHDLQVHSEEIRVQNEQLIKAQSELEQARDRYADLYDFAPIGYLSIDPRGRVVDINLAGSVLFGGTRRTLLDMPLLSAIEPGDRDLYRRFLAKSDNDVPAAVEIRPKSDPRRTLQLLSRPLPAPIGAARFLVAALDITEERRLERERELALESEQARAMELDKEIVARRASEDRVKALLERVVLAQEEERRRIARNLHDHLGQQLTALRLTIDAARQSKDDTAEIAERLELIDRLTTQIDRDVDYLAWDLRPPALDEVGLNAALESLVHEWSVMQKVKAEFHVAAPHAVRLAPGIESHLYRIVQEALNNVSKHANARTVSVMLEQRGDDINVIIDDDGRGFRVDAVADEPARGTSMGLTSMQERAALVGGSVEWESTPGEGTTVFVRIPNPSSQS